MIVLPFPDAEDDDAGDECEDVNYVGATVTLTLPALYPLDAAAAAVAVVAAERGLSRKQVAILQTMCDAAVADAAVNGEVVCCALGESVVRARECVTRL
jgi:hypothetical protein